MPVFHDYHLVLTLSAVEDIRHLKTAEGIIGAADWSVV